MKDTNTKGPGMRRVGAAMRNLAMNKAQNNQADNGNFSYTGEGLDYVGLGKTRNDPLNAQVDKDISMLMEFAKRRYPDDHAAAMTLFDRLVAAVNENVENIDPAEGYDYTTNAEEWKPDSNIVDTLSDMKGV